MRTADGEHHDIDVIVLATGFQVHKYMRPMSIVGRDGITLDDAWGYFTDEGTIDLWPFDRTMLTHMLSAPDPAHLHS